MKTVCDINMCTGCKACLESCKHKCIKIVDSKKALNAVIDENKCINCNLCRSSCPAQTTPEFKKPISWKQGWSIGVQRDISSSGGAASEILKAFIQSGGFVCSCFYKSGDFIFGIFNNLDDLLLLSGSKYVKSNPEGIYEQIKHSLKQGHKLLFVGLPCQVSAVKNYVGNTYTENLYTIDLICHGTPSIQLLKMYLEERHININSLSDICFRVSNKFYLSSKSRTIVPNGVMDLYTMAFLEGLDYTENCYNCKYARLERVSDITLGDSWGSDLKDEEKRGISLILCQTKKGEEILRLANLQLYEVNIDRAVMANHQLSMPMTYNKNRDKFFRLIEAENRFCKSAFLCMHKKAFRQQIKTLLIKLRLYRKMGG